MAPISDFTAALIIPTGVGASQGGYGGDASLWLNLLASVCDTLITHPNVANAAAFQKLPVNALYVEGYALDQFFQGNWSLRSIEHQRQRCQHIGLIIDAGIEAGMQVLHHNTIAAVQQVYGVSIVNTVLTEAPLKLKIQCGAQGASGGSLENPEVLHQAAAKLIKQGATSLALCSRIEEPENSPYSQGVGADPIGGLEAILSHELVRRYQVPCANAPVFDWDEAQPRRDQLVDPRTAAEYITATFLPCVLTGLHKAPSYISNVRARESDLSIDHLNALVLPVDSVGGVPFLAAIEQGVPVICVASNTTVLDITPAKLLSKEVHEQLFQTGKLIYAHSYLEAAGHLQLMKLGLVPAH